MNRRSFLASILKAGVGAMILPPALTYARTWKFSPERAVWVIDWEDIEIGGRVITPWSSHFGADYNGPDPRTTPGIKVIRHATARELSLIKDTPPFFTISQPELWKVHNPPITILDSFYDPDKC